MRRASSGIPERLQFGATFVGEWTQQIYCPPLDQLSEFEKGFVRREISLNDRASDRFRPFDHNKADRMRIWPIRAYKLTSAEMSELSCDRASA